ncbi:Uncharacterized protein conserved in bacteria [Salmonella enterica subsp. arizonae]|uniref:Uncharacterized protein conserved in bacteria n=1 Tax=Salmonella enterica subsp. arizonae TaxID=59203 RepID=A0A2X4TJE5_SALER|nr:Uncharacterized protein conserved in bacteria [Salmonella enterica subsp. arizonae]
MVRGRNCAPTGMFPFVVVPGCSLPPINSRFAGDKMLSMREAISQLENALSIARSLSDAAETAEALPADIQSQVKLTESLKKLARQVWC